MASSALVGVLRVLLTANSAEFETALKQAQVSAKTWANDLQKIGKQASDIGTALTKTLTVPLVGLGAGAIKSAMDFESSFAGVRKTVEATDAEFAQMEQAFRDLAKTIPVNVNELNRLGEAAGALGIPKEEIVDFSRVMALLGVTTNVTADQAAESIAKIQTVFGSAGQSTEEFASTLVHLGNNGASTEAEILELTTRIASAGAVAGMSQAEVLGFAAAMANVGINAEAGGTALSKTINEINVAVSTGGDGLKKFAEVAGMSVTDFAEKFRTDAAGALQAFIAGLGRVHTEGGNMIAIMEEMGIKEIRQSDTLRRLALNTDNVTNALKNANLGWKENTALSEEARKRFETFESQLKLFWAQVRDVGIELGTALLPVMRDLLDAVRPMIASVSDLASGFSKLPEPVQLTAVAMAGVAAAAGPLLYALGQLLISGAAVVGVFKEGAIGAQVLGGAFTVLTSPITLIVGAIGGLAVAWASFKDDWTRAFDVLIPPIGIFRNAIDNIALSLAPYSQQLNDIATIARGVFLEAWTRVSETLADLKDRVITFLTTQILALSDAVVTLANSLRQHLIAVLRGLKPMLDPLINSVAILVAINNTLADAVENASVKLHETADRYRSIGEAAATTSQRTGDVELAFWALGEASGFAADELERVPGGGR